MTVAVEEYLARKLKEELDQVLNYPTINHTIEIISTTVRVDETVFDAIGDTTEKTQETRVSTANCTDGPAVETLTFQVNETRSTSWTVMSEAGLASETAVNATASIPAGPAGGSAGSVGVSQKVTVTFKLGLTRTGVTAEALTITDALTVTTAPGSQTVVRGVVHTTPVHGRVKGAIEVRYRHTYDIDFTWPVANHAVLGYSGYREIPIEVDFETVHLSFTKSARSMKIDCGSDAWHGEHPLFGVPLKVVDEPPAAPPVKPLPTPGG